MDKEFFVSLTADRSPKACVIDGQTIRAKYRGGKGRKLLVLLHPAQPPHSENRPYFASFLPIDAPQLAISDPTLECNDDLASGWYLGSQEGKTSKALNDLVTRFSNFLGCDARIYVGGSSGGFAALNLGAMDPNSLAVAACPQVDLDTYASSSVLAWRRKCFAGLDSGATIKEITGIDLLNFYSGDFKNYLIILVSPGDFGHLYGQVAPLLCSIKPTHRDRLVLDVRYHGRLGHSGSIPPSSYVPWVRAALSAKTFHSSELVEVHRLLISENSDVNVRPSANKNVFTESEIKMADLLRDISLR